MARPDSIYVYGKHALMEALVHAPLAVKKVFLASSAADDALLGAIRKAGVPVGKLGGAGGDAREIEEEAAHQGVIGLVSVGRLITPFERFIEGLAIGPDTALVILGEVQDPHNVGAIIRSAAAFGIKGVLIPEHNQSPITGAVVKVSAGMAFRVPIVSIGNVNQAIRTLKEKGFWAYGLAGEGANDLTKETFDAPTVFVAGNESKGVREKTRDTCDILLSIPMHPRCESLNVAASTAVALYAWSAQHPGALAA